LIFFAWSLEVLVDQKYFSKIGLSNKLKKILKLSKII